VYPLCPSCKTNPLASEWQRTEVMLCTRCAERYGVQPMHPARRPPKPCNRCSGMRFIRAVPRELSLEPQAERAADQVASPMAVTYQVQRLIGASGPSAALPIDARHGYGFLEMYICRTCGFVEWYCNDPERIPIGPRYMTEDLDYGADGPYR